MIQEAGLTITQRRYHGHVAYPLLGFPDIWNTRLPLWIGRKLMAVDEWLSKTWIAKTGWAVMIRAVKPLTRQPLPEGYYQGHYVDEMAKKLVMATR